MSARGGSGGVCPGIVSPYRNYVADGNKASFTRTVNVTVLYRLKWVQCSPMVMLHIKGAAHKNGDIDGTCVNEA